MGLVRALDMKVTKNVIMRLLLITTRHGIGVGDIGYSNYLDWYSVL